MGGGGIYLLTALELRSPWSRCWPDIRLGFSIGGHHLTCYRKLSGLSSCLSSYGFEIQMGQTVAGLAAKSLVRASNEA